MICGARPGFQAVSRSDPRPSLRQERVLGNAGLRGCHNDARLNHKAVAGPADIRLLHLAWSLGWSP